ncbi:hypothetical protein HHK36_001716 [Tetracentron sinense]|uniref:Pyridine nucleotide-disulphide oxidoreductase N-terminal domain-containing protein n=1 Tax=Tetracentron sinense TaxID=13715 RepID=A0A834ZYL3_TETSI|nr:hypothetical protein HHK36_001716 [Tetracentron sinense]
MFLFFLQSKSPGKSFAIQKHDLTDHGVDSDLFISSPKNNHRKIAISWGINPSGKPASSPISCTTNSTTLTRYIVVKFASVWCGMESTVDLFIRKELSLRGFDDEMRTVFAINLEGRGIKLRPETNLSELIKTEDVIRVITGHDYKLMAIVVLFATGNSLPSSYYNAFPSNEF